MHIRRQRPLLHNDEKACHQEERESDRQLQAWSTLGTRIACCVDRVSVQARATYSHGLGTTLRCDRDADARSATLRIGGWRHVDEKLCFQLSVHSKLELDCIENSCAEELTLQSNYFHTVLAVVCSTEISSGSPPVFHECTSNTYYPTHALDTSPAHTCKEALLVASNSWLVIYTQESKQQRLFSMQSSSSLECTLNWKHSFSSTYRHRPILRVADRASASRSQRSVVPRPWLYVARACTLTLSTHASNPCTKSWPGLQLSIWFSFFLVACFLVIVQQWALSSNVHVRYVLLIE